MIDQKQPGMCTINDSIIGNSEIINKIKNLAHKLKGYNANVLIEGETGTGKEVLVRYIHELESNSRRPFVSMNCAAIPDTLFESEFFGHEVGSFTGAIKRQFGKFELANGGDIFLDEINSLPLSQQAKLLRVLQMKSFMRTGGDKPIDVNFRVIAASNVNLDDLVKAGKFREDLFYRLKVMNLKMPPLRDRMEDLPALAEYFLNKHARNGMRKQLSSQALDVFKRYDWPGNIRELENVIQHLIIFSEGEVIGTHHMPREILKPNMGHVIEADKIEPKNNHAKILPLNLIIAKYIQDAVDQCEGNIRLASLILHISRSRIYRLMKQYCRDNTVH